MKLMEIAMNIWVMLGNGFEEIEALSVVDVCRRAEIETLMVSVTESFEVKSARGIRVIADKLISEVVVEPEDMIVIPGGLKGVRNLQTSPQLAEMLKAHVGGDGWLAAICAGPAVPGMLHLLKGKKVCCYPGLEGELLEAEVVFDSVVQDGKLITARGAGVALDFSYAIAEALKGSETAEELKNAMIFK